MGWIGTGIFNDRYSLEKNIGEGYYIFEYGDSEALTAIDTKFLNTLDYEEALKMYFKVVKLDSPLKNIKIGKTECIVELNTKTGEGWNTIAIDSMCKHIVDRVEDRKFISREELLVPEDYDYLIDECVGSGLIKEILLKFGDFEEPNKMIYVPKDTKEIQTIVTCGNYENKSLLKLTATIEKQED